MGTLIGGRLMVGFNNKNIRKSGGEEKMSKSRLITIGLAVTAVAVMYRIPAAKELLTGDEKFLGIF